jgi:tricorn protease
VSYTITNDSPELKTVVADIRRFAPSQDGKKLLIHKGDNLSIIDANPGSADLDKKGVPLGAWSMSVTPREEWRHMFVEAWRLERDYFYDRDMHGVDWKAMLEKYRPLVDRVTTRGELSDLIAQMVAELSTLHTFVRGGDERDGPDNIQVASLAATLARDEAAGGYKVERVFRNDPDQPERAGPLSRPGVDVREGDVIEAINGVPTLSVADCSALLRQKAGVQVLVRVKPAAGGDSRDVIVVPVTQQTATDIRYHEWEHTRRLRVADASKGRIGYVHLRAMGGGDFTDWARHYYPDFNKEGLIIDVRHNRGGNIDSWILSRLLRKVWFYWTDRVGNPPTWNMQQAFRGHLVILCDERTASDGEAITEGFRRLGLGKVIGTRTWGGEVWLSANNFLVDRGIATAGETGVYAPDGTWLIEGHGVDPDIVVDNLPHSTFKGEDAQLAAAVDHLMKLMREQPVPPVKAPKLPDKSFKE